MSEILYHPRATKFLSKLSKNRAKIIIQTIRDLQNYSQWGHLDIKKLKTTSKSMYRLRIGKIRAVFQKDNEAIYILDIDFRGSIY